MHVAVSNQKHGIVFYWGIYILSLYDSVVSGNVIPEKRDWFFTVNKLFSLELLTDIHPIFTESYLRKIDQ